jgi:hypothetical protein
MSHQLKSQPDNVSISRALYMADVIRCQEILAIYHITRGNESASANSTKLQPVSSSPFSPAATQSLQANQNSYHGGEADRCFCETQKYTFKDDLIYSHGLLPLESTVTSTCQFCICFGREGTEIAKAAGCGSTDGTGASAFPKKKRPVSRRHLKFDDFSRHMIEEHYSI